jgi:hypothetical protein
MSRAMQLVTLLCAASLLGNVWLYRELRVRQRAEPRALPAVLPQAQSGVPESNPVAVPATNAAANVLRPTAKQIADKCKRKYEEEFRRQLRDPKERETLKRREVMSLQASNVGAPTRLHLNEQAFGRIVELQAEQNLLSQEASIGSGRSPRGVSVNPQIADEFGESVASKWAEYVRESSGRMAVQGVANLFADVNVPLSEEQRRRLVSVYADELDMQSAQDAAPEMQETPDNLRTPRALEGWLQKLAARQVTFDQGVQAAAASFLTPAQMELLRRKSDLESERFRSLVDSTPQTVDDSPELLPEC